MCTALNSLILDLISSQIIANRSANAEAQNAMDALMRSLPSLDSEAARIHKCKAANKRQTLSKLSLVNPVPGHMSQGKECKSAPNQMFHQLAGESPS